MDKIHYESTQQMQTENIAKRMVDIMASFLLLLCLSPFLLLFSILLLLFSGKPIFFKQVRTGIHNKPFIIWKFRTMELNADQSDTHNYVWHDGVPNDFVFKTPTHQKITTIGKIYRKLSIDELPQLMNVLKGDMSLVGPRPEIPEITHLYNRYQAMRLQLKPGITGYAQVNGRSINSHGQKIDYDLFYIHNRTFALDIKIILKTIKLVIQGKGAW